MLHAADRFVIAGRAVPEDLAPLDEMAGHGVGYLVQDAVRLDPSRARELRGFAQAMPQQPRIRPFPPPKSYEQYPPNPGGVLVGMLRNRNMTWSGATPVLYSLGGVGPFAGSTVGAIAHGRKPLTPELLTGFATVLGVPHDELAALTGVPLPDFTPPRNPTAVEIAELIWDVRRLTADQMRQVRDHAESLLALIG